MYKVIYADSVEDDLTRLDGRLRKKIIDRVEKYLARDPQGLGKPLRGIFKGYWRYRFEDYRVIYRVAPHEILMIVLRVGNRKNVYAKPINN